MDTRSKEKNVESKVRDKPSSQSASVRFDLETSQHPDDFDASLDEADEFLEFSTTSNLLSNSSHDSITNIVTNDSTTNTKVPSADDGTSDESKSTSKRYIRYVQKRAF
jgi:hypothetical protein